MNKLEEFYRVYGAIGVAIVGIPAIFLALGMFAGLVYLTETPVEVNATLISKSYSGSTLHTSAVPVVSSNGSFGMGVATTGTSAKHTTIWENDELGTFVSNNERVFRLSKRGENCLKVKIIGDDIYAVGFCND